MIEMEGESYRKKRFKGGHTAPLKLDHRVFITFDERGGNNVKSGGQDRKIRQSYDKS